MAELSQVAEWFGLPEVNAPLTGVVLDEYWYLPEVRIDATVGNPGPSLYVMGMRSQGKPFFRLAVKSGVRTVKVDVLQPDPTAERPVVRIRANPSIGILADVTATAGTQTTWQTLSVTINPTTNGAFILELENPDPGKPCWFDNVKVQ